MAEVEVVDKIMKQKKESIAAYQNFTGKSPEEIRKMKVRDIKKKEETHPKYAKMLLRYKYLVMGWKFGDKREVFGENCVGSLVENSYEDCEKRWNKRDGDVFYHRVPGSTRK
jgi:hypothetical protein